MSETLSNQPSLSTYFEPKTLNELDFFGEHLHFSCQYAPTDLPKTGGAKWLAKLPKIGGKPTTPMNINLGCGFYDVAGQMIDSVWYGQVRAFDDNARYQGDSLKTSKKPELPHLHELINLRLSSLPNNIYRIALLMHSYHHQPLAKAVSGEINLLDGDGIVIHALSFDSLQSSTTALLAWELTRTKKDWRISAPMREFSSELVTGVNVGKFAEKLTNNFGDTT